MNKTDFLSILGEKIEKLKQNFRDQFDAEPHYVIMGWMIDKSGGTHLFEEGDIFCNLIVRKNDIDPTILEVCGK